MFNHRTRPRAHHAAKLTICGTLLALLAACQTGVDSSGVRFVTPYTTDRECEGSPTSLRDVTSEWTDCVGTFTSHRGAKFSGEWWDGQLRGDVDLEPNIVAAEARFERAELARSWKTCSADARHLDKAARKDGNAGRYLASAHLIQRCLNETGVNSVKRGKLVIPVAELMRHHALMVQNYLRGGDVAKARDGLYEFVRAYPGRNLYYSDGSSFTHTMQSLLVHEAAPVPNTTSTGNISPTLNAELHRLGRR